MLGSIVVRFLSVVLNIGGVLLVIAGSVVGATIASASHVNPIVGLIGGFVGSFLFVAVTFGTAFLILEINNNLIRIAKLLKDSDGDERDEAQSRQISEKDEAQSRPITEQSEVQKQAIAAARRQAIKETLLPTERMCAVCDAKYEPSDYFPSASIWTCSNCKQPLPKE